MMRCLLALAALVLAGVAIYNGDSSRGRIEYVEEVLEQNEITEVSDEYENAPGRPTYIPRTRVCTWRREDGSDAACHDAPRTEYRDEATCLYTEWGAIEMLAAEGARQGVKMNASVTCVAEYDT